MAEINVIIVAGSAAFAMLCVSLRSLRDANRALRTLREVVEQQEVV